MNERPISPITGRPDSNWVGHQEPVQRADNSPIGGRRENHPAYGTISVARVSGSGTALFGSDFLHHNFMTIRISTAELSRSSISTDHTFGGEQIIEVALSEAQWATFVSSPNAGIGVECTIEEVAVGPRHERITAAADEFGRMPRIKPITNRREQFRGEVDERLQAVVGTIDEAIALAGNKKQRELLEQAKSRLLGGLPWVAEMFDEHAEKTVEKMKVEVNAYMLAAIQSAGIAALSGEAPPLQLTEPTIEGESRLLPEGDTDATNA